MMVPIHALQWYRFADTVSEMIKLASLLAPLDMSLRVSYVGSMSKEKVNIDITPAYLKEVVSDNRISNHFK